MTVFMYVTQIINYIIILLYFPIKSLALLQTLHANATVLYNN